MGAVAPPLMADRGGERRVRDGAAHPEGGRARRTVPLPGGGGGSSRAAVLLSFTRRLKRRVAADTALNACMEALELQQFWHLASPKRITRGGHCGCNRRVLIILAGWYDEFILRWWAYLATQDHPVGVARQPPPQPTRRLYPPPPLSTDRPFTKNLRSDHLMVGKNETAILW
jgi:hypothetical protein